jgi:NAD(P)-dependent dehydrogenase (short-subunit alcohol dehydrogenase family)
MSALAGKTVLLTGALGTLGQPQSRILGGAGARLFLLDRRGAPNGESFAHEIEKETKAKADYVGQDP